MKKRIISALFFIGLAVVATEASTVRPTRIIHDVISVEGTEREYIELGYDNSGRLVSFRDYIDGPTPFVIYDQRLTWGAGGVTIIGAGGMSDETITVTLGANGYADRAVAQSEWGQSHVDFTYGSDNRLSSIKGMDYSVVLEYADGNLVKANDLMAEINGEDFSMWYDYDSSSKPCRAHDIPLFHVGYGLDAIYYAGLLGESSQLLPSKIGSPELQQWFPVVYTFDGAGNMSSLAIDNLRWDDDGNFESDRFQFEYGAQSGIEDIGVMDSSVSVTCDGREITVNGKGVDSMVIVFDSMGRRVHIGRGNNFTLPSGGVYFVTVEGRTFKILV